MEPPRPPTQDVHTLRAHMRSLKERNAKLVGETAKVKAQLSKKDAEIAQLNADLFTERELRKTQVAHMQRQLADLRARAQHALKAALPPLMELFDHIEGDADRSRTRSSVLAETPAVARETRRRPSSLHGARASVQSPNLTRVSEHTETPRDDSTKPSASLTPDYRPRAPVLSSPRTTPRHDRSASPRPSSTASPRASSSPLAKRLSFARDDTDDHMDTVEPTTRADEEEAEASVDDDMDFDDDNEPTAPVKAFKTRSRPRRVAPPSALAKRPCRVSMGYVRAPVPSTVDATPVDSPTPDVDADSAPEAEARGDDVDATSTNANPTAPAILVNDEYTFVPSDEDHGDSVKPAAKHKRATTKSKARSKKTPPSTQSSAHADSASTLAPSTGSGSGRRTKRSVLADRTNAGGTPRTSAPGAAAVPKRVADDSDSDASAVTDDGGGGGGRRARTRGKVVNYKEPPTTGKVRREDPRGWSRA